MISGAVNVFSPWIEKLKIELQLSYLLYKYPTLQIQKPGVWRYDKLSALRLGRNVVSGPYAEIIAYSHTARSKVPGRLIVGNNVYLATGCNVRAAGGTITIGNNTMVGQFVSIVAANHSVELNKVYRELDWDQNRTGVSIGDNCWIGAHCIILPGVTIGNGSVISSGSVVYKSVPENEIWAGAPARFLVKVTDKQSQP